jgi:hypothetical protein
VRRIASSARTTATEHLVLRIKFAEVKKQHERGAQMIRDIRSRIRNQARVLAVCSSVVIAGGVGTGCVDQATPDQEDVTFNTTEQAVTATGDPLPGISAADFADAKKAFQTVEELDDGLGPIFNEKACGNCHTQGGIGGAGVQIERRFGRFDNGVFNSLANKGGSLRPCTMSAV